MSQAQDEITGPVPPTEAIFRSTPSPRLTDAVPLPVIVPELPFVMETTAALGILVRFNRLQPVSKGLVRPGCNRLKPFESYWKVPLAIRPVRPEGKEGTSLE